MTLEQIHLAEIAAAKTEVGERLSSHIRNCASCDNARAHRRPTLRCPAGKELAATLTALKGEYQKATAELGKPYPGQLTLEQALGEMST